MKGCSISVHDKIVLKDTNFLLKAKIFFSQNQILLELFSCKLVSPMSRQNRKTTEEMAVVLMTP